MLRCVLCNGVLRYLGKLGTFVWFRCRDCGMDQHYRTEDLPKEEVTDEDE